MRPVALLALLCVLSTAEEGRGLQPLRVTTADGGLVTEVTSHHALILGNAAYRSWRPLPGVAQDVVAVRSALERQGFAVEAALDLDKAQMEQRLASFIAERGGDRNGRVVIYYAGHGHTWRPEQGQELGYLVPVDAPLPEGDGRQFLAHAVPVQRLRLASLELNCRHALFLLDSCFSGTLFAPMRGEQQHVLRQVAEPVRMFITSGSADEEVPDHSVFRQVLVDALDNSLADTDRDGWTTGSELALYLRQQVMGRRGADGARQTPQAGVSEQEGLRRGEIVFGRGLKAERPVPEGIYRIRLDLPRLAAHGLVGRDVVRALRAITQERQAALLADAETVLLEPGRILALPEEVSAVVIDASGGQQVTLRDVTSVALEAIAMPKE